MQKANFCQQDMLCGVNWSPAGKELTFLEKEHFLTIQAPQEVERNSVFEVKIKVGGVDGVKHPNEAGHFIEWIELYGQDTFLGRTNFSGGSSFPETVFKISLRHAKGPLKVWEKCNLHGLWESIKEISIK